MAKILLLLLLLTNNLLLIVKAEENNVKKKVNDLEEDLAANVDLSVDETRSEHAKGRQMYFPPPRPRPRGRPPFHRPFPAARPPKFPSLSRRVEMAERTFFPPTRKPDSHEHERHLPESSEEEIGLFGTAASNLAFREWESKRMATMSDEDQLDDVPPSAFTPGPHSFLPLLPPRFRETEETEDNSFFPKRSFPSRSLGKARSAEEEFERSYSAEDFPSGNQRLNLQTQYFSLPSVGPTVPARSIQTGKPKRPSRIPVLVKKLAKRPIPKDGKDRTPIFLRPGATIVKPPLIRNITDFCADGSLECDNNSRTVDRNETSPLKMLSFLRSEVWVIPVVVAAGALASVLLIFEIYLISKAITANPSGRHLFLGQMLMLGMLLSCVMAAVLSMKPTMITCAATRVGIGLSYTIIYATLLVKLVFLVSLNSGVYLPATYQCLLLCFALLIQVVIGIQWLMQSPADVIHTSLDSGGTYSSCNVTFQRQILGLLYVIFLILAVVVLAFKSRGVRENYREAMYIGLTMGFTVCIFTIWILAGFMSPIIYSDVCVACGLVGCAAITFIIMFMPKGRQLSAMGREGVYTEDRNDVYTEGSSTHSTGSGGTPSPSFFPIKPGKLVHRFRQNDFPRDRLDTPPPLPSPRKTGKLFNN